MKKWIITREVYGSMSYEVEAATEEEALDIPIPTYVDMSIDTRDPSIKEIKDEQFLSEQE
jgi:hypothetical protein